MDGSPERCTNQRVASCSIGPGRAESISSMKDTLEPLTGGSSGFAHDDRRTRGARDSGLLFAVRELDPDRFGKQGVGYASRVMLAS